MLRLHEEKFHPSAEFSFDITSYDELIVKKPIAFRIHEDYELTLLYNCSGKRMVGDSIEYFVEEDLFLIGPNLPHLILVDNPKTAKAICFHFTESSFGHNFFKAPQNSRILEMLKRASQGLSFYGEDTRWIKNEVKNIFNLDPFEKMIALLTILNKLSKTTNYQTLTCPGYRPHLKRNNSGRMDVIFEYIMENFQNKITLEELASLVNVSPSTFNRLFKKTKNKNFSEFLSEVRIGHACKLLMNSDLSISEICFQSGYNNITHFNDQFKKSMGESPGNYRKNFR